MPKRGGLFLSAIEWVLQLVPGTQNEEEKSEMRSAMIDKDRPQRYYRSHCHL